MRTLISEKRLRAMIEQKLLKESKGAGQSGMINFTGGRTIAGLRYKNNRIEITDGRFATQMLTMISRGDTGMMGNIFEDIAEGSTIPSIIGGGSGGNQNNYLNLNDTLNMANSPAADVGDTNFASGVSTNTTGGATTYTINGICWSVKSTAGRAESGFTTLTTAVGQLGAVAYDEAANFNEITDRNSQPQAYQFLVDNLPVGDKIQYKMGLCYYKYDRQSSNVTLEQPVDNDGNPFYVFTITTPVTTVYASILPASVGKAVCRSYYTGDTDTSSLFKLPFAEKLVDSDRQIRLKQRIAKVGSQSPSEKMDCCVATTPDCNHYKGSLVRWDPNQNKYVSKDQELFKKVATAKVGQKSNEAAISRHKFKFVRPKINDQAQITKGAYKPATRKYMYSDEDAADIIDDLTRQYKYNRSTYTQVMGLQNTIGSPEKGGETIDPSYSMNPAGRNLPVTPDETTLAAALYRGNVDRIKAFRSEIAHRIGLKAAGILSENLLAADNTLKNEIQSKYTGVNLPDGALLDIDDITDIVITAKAPDDFMSELIDDLPEKFLDLDEVKTIDLKNALKNMVNATESTLKKVLKEYIEYCRNNTPTYLSIKSLQMPVMNVDDRSNPTFKTLYCRPEDNTFTIERIPDTSTIAKADKPAQPIYNFRISSQTKVSEVSLFNSKVSVTSGSDGLVSHSTGWSTLPTLIPNENIHLTPNAAMAATNITTIVKEQDTAIKNAIAAQTAALSRVTAGLSIPMQSEDRLGQKLGRQAGGGISSSPSAQSATSLVGFDSNISAIATRYRIGGDLFSLGEAKEILDAVAKTVESISVSSTNLSYPTSNNPMEINAFLIKKMPTYSDVMRAVLTNTPGAGIVSILPLSGADVDSIQKNHERSVKYFLESIRKLKRLYASGTTLPNKDKQIIRSSIAAAIRDTQILEDQKAVAWLSTNGPPDFLNGEFIYENTSQPGDETDITDVYYVGLSLLISSYAYTLSCLLPDGDLSSDIMDHLEDIGSDLNSLASQLDVMNPPVDLTGMDKGTDKDLNRVSTLQSSLPTGQPLKSAAESRLYNNILKDIMEVASKKKDNTTQQLRKVKIVNRSPIKLLEGISRVINNLDSLLRSEDRSAFSQGLMLASSLVQDSTNFEQMQAVRRLVSKHYNRLVDEYNMLKLDIEDLIDQRKAYYEMTNVSTYGHQKSIARSFSDATEGYVGMERIDSELPELREKLNTLEVLIQSVIDDVFMEGAKKKLKNKLYESNQVTLINKLDLLLHSNDLEQFQHAAMIVSGLVQDNNPNSVQRQQIKDLIMRHYKKLVEVYNFAKNEVATTYSEEEFEYTMLKYVPYRRSPDHGRGQYSMEKLEELQEDFMRRRNYYIKLSNDLEKLIQIVIDDVFFE